ncbi:hypothetical protein TNIN_91101 [Trichonephila inaurata madagascariensis]|uniref:Uncharacterized protein n=1 Tax=Trichonephila inaurata madagascariensis TaxID=2747483 RepID=A0A8X7BPG1_9ARAC|nr:hypothetical protein TNIN_91101 [Trichonephila inaurata madagascariensis]
MPLSKDPSCLGDSKQTALRRLNSLRRRLVQDRKILELYRNFIHKYLEMGQMEEDEYSAVVYYLPHHVQNNSFLVFCKGKLPGLKRFIENARYPMSRTMGPLKCKELSESLKCIIKNIQRS